MEILTEQILFDQSVRHMAEQKAASMVKNGTCRYKSSEGLKCAVGGLFLPGEYKKKMEGADVEVLAARGLLPERLVPFKPFLLYLQQCHDHAMDLEDLLFKLQKLAEKFNLSPSSVLEIKSWRGWRDIHLGVNAWLGTFWDFVSKKTRKKR